MKNTRYKSNMIIRFAFALIFVFLIISVINMQIELSDLKTSKTEVEKSLNDVADRIMELNYKLNAPRDSDYYEQVARERLGYRNPNEIIFYNDIAD